MTEEIKNYIEDESIGSLKAKIRNNLSPFWNLLALVEAGADDEYIKLSAENCKQVQDLLLSLIDEINN